MTDAIALQITEQVNKEGDLKLAYKKTLSEGSLLCVDEAGTRHAIVCYDGLMTPIIRSVLKEGEPGKGFKWTGDGHPARNATLVKMWPESHRYQPTPLDVVEVLDGIYPDNSWMDLLKSGAFSMPDNVSLEAVISTKEMMLDLNSYPQNV